MTDGIINIHGKEYRTVAYRVNEFRTANPMESGWGIHSEIVELGEEKAVVRAWVTRPDGVIVGTGLAEEFRKASKINATSALENAETSAIGRALAACGLAGTEYASANEVQGTIASQEEMIAAMVERAKTAIDAGDWVACCDMDRADDAIWHEAWKKLAPKTRGDFKAVQKKRDEYRDQLNHAAMHMDFGALEQLSSEMTEAEKKCVFRVLQPEAQDVIKKFKQEKAA